MTLGLLHTPIRRCLSTRRERRSRNNEADVNRTSGAAAWKGLDDRADYGCLSRRGSTATRLGTASDAPPHSQILGTPRSR
jgi:hypothetical protein